MGLEVGLAVVPGAGLGVEPEVGLGVGPEVGLGVGELPGGFPVKRSQLSQL